MEHLFIIRIVGTSLMFYYFHIMVNGLLYLIDGMPLLLNICSVLKYLTLLQLSRHTVTPRVNVKSATFRPYLTAVYK